MNFYLFRTSALSHAVPYTGSQEKCGLQNGNSSKDGKQAHSLHKELPRATIPLKAGRHLAYWASWNYLNVDINASVKFLE